MTFKINDDNTSVNGTSHQGYLTTTYDALVARLGNPMKGSDDHKTTAEWCLEFEEGTVATIYDWKLSSTPKNLYDWHIGGKSYGALDKVEEALGIQTRISKF